MPSPQQKRECHRTAGQSSHMPAHPNKEWPNQIIGEETTGLFQTSGGGPHRSPCFAERKDSPLERHRKGSSGGGDLLLNFQLTGEPVHICHPCS
jgi:hypothetical protein